MAVKYRSHPDRSFIWPNLASHFRRIRIRWWASYSRSIAC